MTRAGLAAFLSSIIVASSAGTTCQNTPYLSVSRPQTVFCPPSESLSHGVSISFCVSTVHDERNGGREGDCGPPFKAMNSRPLSRKVTVMTDPSGLPDAFAPSPL